MENEKLIGKFIIVKDIKLSDYFKDKDTGEIVIFNSLEDAMVTCGMYEFDNVLVLEIKANHREIF